MPFSLGGSKLRHGAVALTQDVITPIRAADPTRKRIQLFNATAAGTGSTVYVGNRTDIANAALAAANGWPLREEWINDVENKYWKELANVLELFTQGGIFGLAVGAGATVKFIEEAE